MIKLKTLVSFSARHALATGAVVITGCVFWTLAYAGLFIWAVVSDSGLGSPAAYPLGIALVLCAGTAACLLLFLPATAASEVLCRARRLPTLMGVPLTFVFFCILTLSWSLVAHFVMRFDAPWAWLLAAGLIVTLAVPLGLYWWAAEFPRVARDLVGLVRSWLAARRRFTA